MTDLISQLTSTIKGTYDGLQTRLKEVPYSWTAGDLKVSGNFYYLAFRNSLPTTDDFVEYIYYRITAFCIPEKERVRNQDKYTSTNDMRYIIELHDKARKLFVRAQQSAKTTGEVGELILFILLEGILRAPQVACKMYLKTSEQVPVHGSDSIHAMLGPDGITLRLIWGESKLYQNLNSALDQACDSIKNFTNPVGGRSPMDRDIDVLIDHMNVANEDLKEALLKYFDPYEEESNSVEHSFACFVGFDSNWYVSNKGLAADKCDDEFCEDYKARIEAACKTFESKMKLHGIDNMRMHFFLVPFESVAEVRAKFLEKVTT